MADYAVERLHGQDWKCLKSVTIRTNVFPFVDGTIGKVQMFNVIRYCQWNEEKRYWEQIMLDGQQSTRDALAKAYKEQYNL